MSEFADGVKLGLSFVIKNKAPQNKSLRFFNHKVDNGKNIDLMQIPGISEDDIKASLVKGDLGKKLRLNYIEVVSSTLNFESTDSAYTALLTSFGLNASSSSSGSVGSISNLASLTLINDASESDGAARNVDTVSSLFKLDKTSTLTVDGITIVATKSGTGRWVRDLSSFSNKWAYRTVWYVDPSLGNDENDGGVIGTPLKTMRELTRRMNNGLPRSLVTVNLLNNVTDANDWMQLSTKLHPQGTLGPNAGANVAGTIGLTNTNVVVRIIGLRTTASFTDPNTASTSALTLTANCTPPDMTQGQIGPSGTAGLPVLITVSGFDFTPHIGKMVEVLTSAQANAVGGIATILAAPSSGVAWVQPLVKLSTASAAKVGATQVNTADYPSTGSTIRIYTTTTWAPWVGVGEVSGFGTTCIAVRDVEYTTATINFVRGQHMYFEGCTFRRPVGTASGGEGGPIFSFNGCGIVFPDPTGGRTPTQWTVNGGEQRFGCCGFLNTDMRIREGNGKANFSNCVFNKGLIMSAGAGDVNRSGPTYSLVVVPPAAGLTITGSDYGLGMFNWPGPNSLGPSPATTRATNGAAITFGHGSQVSFGATVYGSSATSGTYGVMVQEGAHLYLSEQLTYQTSPVNPGSPAPNYFPASLRINGVAGDLQLDGYATHVPDGYWREFVAGTRPAQLSNLVTLNSWKDWEDAPYSRYAKGSKTGAGIFNIFI